MPRTTTKPVPSYSAAIDEYLQELWDAKGTDLLLTAGAPPLIRVDGEMRPVENGEPMTPDQVGKLVDAVLSGGENLVTRFEIEKEVDFSFNWQGLARFRGNAFRQRHASALALRLIPFTITSF